VIPDAKLSYFNRLWTSDAVLGSRYEFDYTFGSRR